MNITRTVNPDRDNTLGLIMLQEGIRHRVVYTATDAEGNYDFGSTAQEARLNLRRRYVQLHGDTSFNPNSIF